MKGDVKGKTSPLTGKSEFLVPTSSPLWRPRQTWFTGPWILDGAVSVPGREGSGKDREFIVDSSQRPRAAEAVQAETGLGWPTMVLSETGRLQLSGVMRGGLRVG